MNHNSNSVQHQYIRIAVVMLIIIMFVGMCFKKAQGQSNKPAKTALVVKSQYDTSAQDLANGFQLLYNKSQAQLRTSQSNLSNAKKQLATVNKSLADKTKSIKQLKGDLQKSNLAYLTMLQKVKDISEYLDTHPKQLPGKKIKQVKIILQL